MTSHFLEETRRLYAGGTFLRSTPNANFSNLTVYEIEVDQVKKIVNNTQDNLLLNIFRSQMSLDLSIKFKSNV